MQNVQFGENPQFESFNNLRQLKKGRKVFLGDKSDPRNCKYLKEATVEHNWPSHWHSRFPGGYILLSINDEKMYFDLAQQTVYGKPAYIFAATKDVERICLVKCAEEQKTIAEGQKKVEEAKLLFAEGVKIYTNGDLGGAEQKFKVAAELDPSHAEAHSRLGHTLVKLRRYEEALKPLNRALSLTCDVRLWILVYDDIGLATSNLGDQTGAISSFYWSIMFNPRNAKALVHRGISHRKTGEYDRAYADALDALKWRPAYPPALRLKKELEAAGHITPHATAVSAGAAERALR